MTLEKTRSILGASIMLCVCVAGMYYDGGGRVTAPILSRKLHSHLGSL